MWLKRCHYVVLWMVLRQKTVIKFISKIELKAYEQLKSMEKCMHVIQMERWSTQPHPSHPRAMKLSMMAHWIREYKVVIILLFYLLMIFCLSLNAWVFSALTDTNDTKNSFYHSKLLRWSAKTYASSAASTIGSIISSECHWMRWSKSNLLHLRCQLSHWSCSKIVAKTIA